MFILRVNGYVLGLSGVSVVRRYRDVARQRDLFDIKYRVEDRIEIHGEDVQPNQSTLNEMYNRQTQVERTNEACKDWP